MAGNGTTCDPAGGGGPGHGQPQPVTLAGLAPAEHLLTVANGSPGVTTLKVEVDGTALAPLHLDDGRDCHPRPLVGNAAGIGPHRGPHPRGQAGGQR